MPTITVQLATAVRRTFRVEQVAGMFDVPLGERVKHELTAEVPGLDEPWTIGAIVGPSGSGKTTLARAAFGDAMYRPRAWPKDRAIIDCFGNLPVKLLTQALAAVGLGSPVAWVKPYRVLSTGEKFRAELLRAVLEAGERGPGDGGRGALLAIDEFTGALDRTVAKTTCAALARLLRCGQSQGSPVAPSASVLRPPSPPCRFVAVTCHHDILPWLSPDWTVELGRGPIADAERHGGRSLQRTAGQANSGTRRSELRDPRSKLIRGRPRKPSFRFGVERVPQSVWWMFEPHHYLAGGLAASASCYAALWNREPIAFCAVVGLLGCRGMKRIQRLVTLPEFQGMGIGSKLLDSVAACEAQRGFRITITASHPAIIAHCSRSPRWHYLATKKTGGTPQRFAGRQMPTSTGRAVASFEWRGRAKGEVGRMTSG
jgi:GNAT superfamily N-acetyltransferase